VELSYVLDSEHGGVIKESSQTSAKEGQNEKNNENTEGHKQNSQEKSTNVSKI
jgi:hypothetical protein